MPEQRKLKGALSVELTDILKEAELTKLMKL